MNSVSYIIPLDELDLNLLPNTYTPRRDVTPLWNLNRNEICEFRIYSDSDNQSNKDVSAQIQEMRTTMCHICKIDVPIQYLREHRASSKHITYLKIANTAVQRLKDEVNNDVELEESESLKYFCCHCITVVPINDSKKHDNSTNHRNAVFLDKYIRDFLDLYEDSDTIKDTKPLQCETSNSKDSDQLLAAIERTEKVERNNFELNSYLNLLRDKYKMSTNIKVIGNKKLEIDIEGSKVQVDTDNFHGMKTKDVGFVECVVCKEMVRDEEKFQHMMDPKHMYRVSTPMKDIHCRREIYPLFHHCVLCNIIIENYREHTVSDQTHNLHLEAALKHHNSTENTITSSENLTPIKNSDKNYLNSNKYGVLHETSPNNSAKSNSVKSNSVKSNNTTKSSLCKHCNIEIRSTRRQKHSITARHMWNTKSPYHYLYTVNTITCRVCEVDDDNVESHVNSEDHIQKYKEYISENSLVKIDERNFFCMFCFELVLIKNELLHTYNPDHRKLVTRATTNENYHCSICDATLPNGENSIQIHNDGKPHKKKLAKLINKDLSLLKTDSLILEPTDSLIHLKCPICNILVANNKSSIAFHLKNSNHINKHEELLKDNYLEIKENYIYCNVCNVSVGNKIYIMHLSGKQHLKKLKQYNESKNVNETPITINETEININETEININETEININETEININETETNEINTSSDEESNKDGDEVTNDFIETKMKECLKHFEGSDSPKELVCTICDVKVPFTYINMKGHSNGYKHLQKMRDLDTNSNSDEDILNESGYKIYDSDIETKMKEFLKYFQGCDSPRQLVCTICDVAVPFTYKNMKEHVNGNRHLLKIIEDEISSCD